MKCHLICFFVVLCYLIPIYSMKKKVNEKKNPKKEIILCNKTDTLTAKEEIREFMNKADVGTCYIHLVNIAEKNQNKMKEKLGSTMHEFGKFAWGAIGGWLGSAGSYFAPKERILKRLIGAKRKVADVFFAASDQKETSEKLITQMLHKQEPDELHPELPGQIASLCATKVISCMEEKKEEVIKQINAVHKKVEKKGWSLKEKFKFWGMSKVIPLFIAHCIENKKDWQLFFTQLEKPLETSFEKKDEIEESKTLRDGISAFPQDDKEEIEESEDEIE